MNEQGNTLLLVSRDQNVCAAFQKENGSAAAGLRVCVASSVQEALCVAWNVNPALIVLEESACMPAREPVGSAAPRLEAAVNLLADIAPVMILAAPGRKAQLAALLAAGAAEFIARTGDDLSGVLAFLEERIEQCAENLQTEPRPIVPPLLEPADADFGEILRHELNNPLTGILGNAELLLAEVRRRQDGRLPQSAQQRLETITDLAVRLRNTVRRLSQEWQEKHTQVRTSA